MALRLGRAAPPGPPHALLASSARLARIAPLHSGPPPAARRGRAFAPLTTSALKVYVKAQPGTSVLGDCPFSQRVLMMLEEKNAEYTMVPVDISDKPDWFVKLSPNGGVPVLLDGNYLPHIMGESAEICDYLEEKFPEPKLESSEGREEVGANVFGAFVQFVKSPPDDPEGKEAALLKELKALDAYLDAEGPYIGGEGPCSLDLGLTPKLLHMRMVLKEYKDWEVPAELTALRVYMELMFSRESFKKTVPEPLDSVVEGWRQKVEDARSSHK